MQDEKQTRITLAQRLYMALQDMRFAVRAMRKSPAFASVAILTLAFGIGANTAIFQLVDAVRLRMLPVADPQSLATIEVKGGLRGFGISSNDESLTYPLWEQIRDHQDSFSDIFAWASSQVGIALGEREKTVQGLWITGETFPTLGIVPYRGRLFTPEDTKPGCGTPGLVISYAFWQSEFGGRDSAIGSNIRVVNSPVQIIGITPPDFFGLEVGKRFDVALPFCSRPSLYRGDVYLTKRDYFWVSVTGRLKPGWSEERASSQLEAISPGIFEATAPEGDSVTLLAIYRKFTLAAYHSGRGLSPLRRRYDTSLWLLLAITGLVLLIACANLANLMLVRASAREKEMAVRLALGATPGRVLQLLLVESLLLAVTGSILGICLAPLFSSTIVKFLTTERDPLQLEMGLDWRVLIFAIAMAGITCVMFGFAPAFRSSRTDPAPVLKIGGRGVAGGRQRFSFQRTLVVSQIAFSTVLLAGALLFVRSFWNLMTIDPGFSERDIVLVQANFRWLNLPPERYESFKHELLTQIRTIPLVDAAATSTHIPLNNSNWSLGVRSGRVESDSKFTWVSPGYFQTMKIPLLAGRDFNDRDTAQSQHVAVVNETFVRVFLGGKNPLGKTFRTNAEPDFPETEYEVIGVVKDTKYADLRDTVPPVSFAPAPQFPEKWYWTALFVRSTAPPVQVISAIREKVAQLYPELRVDYHLFQTGIQEGLVRERTMALLSGFFGALAAFLAMLGLYGVISYIIEMRRNEIGIRMALGATREDVVGIVVRQTFGLLALGVAIGLVMAVAVTRAAQALLFGLAPNDPPSLIGAACFLAAVALLAAVLPAYRAARIDPMNALRYE